VVRVMVDTPPFAMVVVNISYEVTDCEVIVGGVSDVDEAGVVEDGAVVEPGPEVEDVVEEDEAVPLLVDVGGADEVGELVELPTDEAEVEVPVVVVLDEPLDVPVEVVSVEVVLVELVVPLVLVLLPPSCLLAKANKLLPASAFCS